LPVVVHKQHKVFVPELVFGHLLTSDNYDDTEKKITGGRNGFGAKLTNVFSQRFQVETACKGKLYKQQWLNNMSRKNKPVIKKNGGQDFTCVEFWPDLQKFGMSKLDSDSYDLMCRRVVDMAGTTGGRCTVTLNGKKLPIKSFEDYCACFHSSASKEIAYSKPHKRWEVLVARTDGDGFQQCSFVNSISTPKGGTHLNHVVDQITEMIIAKAKPLNRGGPEIKKVHVKNHLWVFVSCNIENPAFSSQTKEHMTLKPASFGSSCPIKKSLIDEICDKTGIVDAIIADMQKRVTSSMDKMVSKASLGKRVLGIPKLEDANEAGGKLSHECTLILTEGDSAKALAVAGLSVIGRDRYGVFPLRGKLLNVRDASQKSISENKEIMNICKILGLQLGKKNPKEMDLRYGAIMIMADQDYDGSHIKGLLINFIHHWWPDLLRQNGNFVQEFVTPIIKCSQAGKETIQFFTMGEYEAWKLKNQNGRGWKIKYYKGLGTSTAAEAKEYFKAIDQHRINFVWKEKKDGELIDLAFNKSRADDRKNWMNKYQEGTYIDHSKDAISYQDFINLELVQFSRYDLMRAVPNVMDGLKPSQRKVLFSCFKRNLRSDVKVAQLVGYIAEHSAYHHGEMSLAGTIVQMAQDYVGSNNINLLVPSGQFGTRIAGGKDSASARYIFTRLSPVTRCIFSPLDDPVLTYQNDDGQKIEPYWYCPVIPMVLVNGAEGIGTGWATSIPNYNPRDIIENLRLFIRGKTMKKMRPWYRGFLGKINPTEEKGKYESVGVWKYIEGRGEGIEITELPLKKWTNDYKDFLQNFMTGAERKSKFTVQDLREYHTDRNVHFVLKMSKKDVELAEDAKGGGMIETFKLKKEINETNMVLFDHEGKIKRYSNVIEIMLEFGKVRLKQYDVRKKYLVEKLTIEMELLANRARFIGMIIAKKLHINNRKKVDIVKDLTRLRFRKFGDDIPPRTGFEYLLGMQIVSLTLERKLELEKALKEKTRELGILKKTTIQQMWEADLARLEQALDQMENPGGTKRKDGEDAPSRSTVKSKGKQTRVKKGRSRGKKGRGQTAEEDEDARGDEEEAAGDDEADAPAELEDGFSGIFSDMARWTAGMVSGPGGSGKRRRLS